MTCWSIESVAAVVDPVLHKVFNTTNLLIFLVLALLGFVIPWANEVRYRIRSKKFGAQTPPVVYNYPFGIPEVFNKLHDMASDDFLNRMQRDADMTPKVQTLRQYIAGQPWVATYHPENIKTVLASNFKDYSLGYRWNSFLPLLGNGIFTLSGEGWKHSRAMLRPQFSREQVTHMNSMKEHVNILMERFEKETASGQTVNAQALYHYLTIDTATEFLFGISSDTLKPNSPGVKGPRGVVTGKEFADAFTSSLYQLAVRLMFGPAYFLGDSLGFRSNVSTCHNFVDHFVHKALEAPLEKDDVSESYVFIRELTKETRDPVVIRDQAFNILLAGRDTTASLLSYTTFYLGQNKEIYAKLREAVLNDFGTSEDGITYESLKKCIYLRNVINEVLRLHPIVPVNFRTAIRDTVLPTGGGPNGDQPVLVEKDTNLFYIPYVMQRAKCFWGDDGDSFKPDRWNEQMSHHTWDYIPFNGGPRICLGQQYALTEASLTLVRLAQRFKDIIIHSPDPITTSPRNIRQWMRLTSSVAGGVITSFVPADDQ